MINEEMAVIDGRPFGLYTPNGVNVHVETRDHTTSVDIAIPDTTGVHVKRANRRLVVEADTGATGLLIIDLPRRARVSVTPTPEA